MNPEQIPDVLTYLAALVSQGAISRIGEGITEGIAKLLREAAADNPRAQLRLSTFAEEPDDENNRHRLAQQLMQQLAGNTAALERLEEQLAHAQAAYPYITIDEHAQVVAASEHVAQAAHGAHARQVTSKGQSRIDMLFQGDIAGNVYINGKPIKYPATLLRAYLNVLRNVCDTLPLTTAEASNDRPLTLQDVYIALDVTDQPLPIAQQTMGPRRHTVLSAFCDDEHGMPPRLLLLGGPGTGKSTLVNYLTLCLAEANLDTATASTWLKRLHAWTYGVLLPVRIVLNEFAACKAVQQAERGSVELLHTFLRDSKANTNPLSDETIALLDDCLLQPSPQAVLLFDGLDEVVDGEVLKRTVETIAAAAQTYRHAPLLVTCRVLDYDDSSTRQQLVMQHGLRRCDLLPLNDEQIKQFVGTWYNSYQTRGRQIKGDATSLLHTLKDRRELRKMADSPLLLTMMAIVHASNRLPETRAELYMRCIEQLLIEWRRERDQPDVLQQLAIPEFGREALLQLMASLGYEAHSAAERSEAELTQPADLERHTALATIERTLAIYIKGDNREERCEKAASEIINKVARRNGLLLKHSTSVYRFAHRSFQEFLAGYALINRPNAVQQWLQHTQDVHWHEAIQLMIGYVASSGTEIEKPLKLVEHLNRRSGSERVLAGELLRLIGQSRVERYNQSLRDVDSPPVTVWDDTLASLIDLMQTGSPPDAPALLRVQAGRILGHLGDPRPGVCLLPPDMVAITGGTFTRGEGNEEHTVKVATFEIARYLLTNAQWKLFMDAGGYDPNQEWWDAAGRAWLQNKGYTQPRYWNDENFGIARPNHPVVAISWYEGMAFCRWLNGHKGYNPDGYTYTLPSEAEWEYTARRTMRRTYPWGTATPDAEWANFAGTYNGTTAVGCFPEGATPEDGIHDLAGIVWEWTRSYYRDYPHGPSDEQETVESSTSTRYVLRGGGWVNHAHNLRATDHVNFPPEDRYYNVGCRLVRHPAYRASMNIAAPDAK